MFYFRCSRTGLLYPSDYVEEWGRKYGIGLGPVPVSEALVNMYMSPLIPNPEHPEITMYPVATCRAQVDLVDIGEEPSPEQIPVLAIDDPHMDTRAEIMRSRQRAHKPELERIHAQSMRDTAEFVV